MLRVLSGIFLFFILTPGQELRPQAPSGNTWSVQWEPQQLVNGSAVLFRVSRPGQNEQSPLRGTWQDRKLSFRYANACNCWYALGAVGLDTPPGRYPLRVELGAEDNRDPAFVFNVTVGEKNYPRTEVTGIPGKYVQPPPEVTARIEEESAFKKQVFSRIEPESFWDGQFAAPVPSVVTAIFGSARVVNKTQKTVHQGMDFRAAVGTPVHATNAGKVVLARNLYFEGNCVMIDHGDGLLTLYMHLSEFRVKEGDSVKSGQLLGLSGNTGRVNGPHLHFAARWQGLYLDPETLLALHPPAQR